MPEPDAPLEREIALPDPAATQALARAIGAVARPGDFIGLQGDLGAGKTMFARAFIHARQDSAGLPREEVPSPTFTLVQLYELPDLTVWHFDLYRLARASDAYELGLEEAASGGLALVEWADRLGPLLPPARLQIVLGFGAGEEMRTARLSGYGEAGRRLIECCPA